MNFDIVWQCCWIETCGGQKKLQMCCDAFVVAAVVADYALWSFVVAACIVVFYVVDKCSVLFSSGTLVSNSIHFCVTLSHNGCDESCECYEDHAEGPEEGDEGQGGEQVQLQQ